MSRDPQSFSGEPRDEWLRQSLDSWDAGEPSAKAWGTLDESLSSASGDVWLGQSFGQWDAGEPSAETWETLDESLSVEAVWNRVDQSLVASEHLPDEWIAAAHGEWNPQHENDGWDKLNESLSLEQVWKDLDRSLSEPVRMRMPIWKLAAASVVALFLTQQLSDAPTLQDHTAATFTSAIQADHVIDSPVKQQNTAPGTVTYTASEQPANDPQQKNVEQQNTIVSPQQLPVVGQEQRIAAVHPEEQDMNGQVQDSREPLYDQDPVVQIPEPEKDAAVVELADLRMDPLTKRTWGLQPEQVELSRFPVHRTPYPNWSVQVGAQLSILNEDNRNVLTSTRPRVAMSADIGYRHRMGPVQFMYALGMSRYSQKVGQYLNGEYTISRQQINTLQFSSSVGYSYRRLTVYGGLLVSKVLSGVEQKDSRKQELLKVYTFSQMQSGFTAGADWRLKTFRRTGNTLSVGAQYQWLSTLNGQKTSFESIQGIRFQTKFSF